jgi:Flp pilus assembly protein TadG
MKPIRSSFFRRVHRDQRGQALVMVVLGMVAFMGVAGLTIDIGHAYSVRNQLQISTNAAGLAAAGDVWVNKNLTTATTTAITYAKANPIQGLSFDTGYPAVHSYCVQYLASLSGATCTSSSDPNAIRVTEQVSVPTTFMRLFNIKTLTVRATSTASMMGGSGPWNIAIIADATGSTTATDTNCKGVSQFECTLEGIRLLLSTVPPCSSANGSNCTPENANVRVALFAFPSMLTNDLSWVNNCASGTYNADNAYTLPPTPYSVLSLPPKVSANNSGTNSVGYTPASYTMDISGLSSSQSISGDVFGTTVSGYTKTNKTITWNGSSWEMTYTGASGTGSNPDRNGFVSDYYDATSSSNLNSSSSIVKAIGTGTGKNCLRTSPMETAFNNDQVKGSNITYYAAAIYAAQAALEREHIDHPDTNSAIILIGDGDQKTPAKYFPSGTDAIVTSKTASTCTFNDGTKSITKTCPTNFPSKLSSSTLGYDTLLGTGLYPSYQDQCQQSIQAAQDVQNSAYTTTSTKFFSVAYGAASTGCTYDTTKVVSTGLNVSFSVSSKGMSPCATMENLATDLTYFYSDYLQSGSGSTCGSDTLNHNLTSLSQIFLDIGGKFTHPRLLPNSASAVLIN